MIYTEDEIALSILKNIELKDADRIRSADHPISLHHGFGTWVRNHYRLWKRSWDPEIVDGVDVSEDHPDAVSNRIVTKVWEELKK